ncbi:unnamed protein product [Linum tenue]|uniref:Major facilitator superfamily (MFS) profile domain-containing protein n=1 Tax=Linum tenue TaxID=586396 RepID=A0AAV0JWF9_9ROSI|nr:unnamed protein product [Linum tenue]
MRATSSIIDDLDLSKNDLDLFTICANKGAYALGALVTGFTANCLCGRRYFLGVGGAIYLVGALLVALSDNYGASMFGRTMTGFGVGMGLLIGPIFIAETAPSTTRGYHGTIPQVLMAAGTMSAYAVESALVWAPQHIAWRVTVGLTTLPTVAFVYYTLARLAHDTPCWHMMCGQVSLAEEVMERCGADGTEPYHRREQLQHVAGFALHSIVDRRRVELFPRRIPGFWSQAFERCRPLIRDLFTTMGLLVAQEATCEQLTLVRFVPLILLRNGLTSRLWSALGGVMLAVIKLLSTLAAMEAAGWSMAGRKRLLLVSFGVVGCAMGFLCGTSFADSRERIVGGTAFALSCFGLVILEAGMAFGLGPIPWMYGPEMFPLAVRAPSLGVCLAFRFAIGILLEMTLPLLYSSFERIWLRFLFGCGAAVVGFSLSCRFVRETTGGVLADDPVD